MTDVFCKYMDMFIKVYQILQNDIKDTIMPIGTIVALPNMAKLFVLSHIFHILTLRHSYIEYMICKSTTVF